MSSIHRLKPEHLDALRKGRAIPFLLDHRVAELPGHALTVIGMLDNEQIFGVLLPDDQPDVPLVEFELPNTLVVIDDSVSPESADAAAVHRLWLRWTGGVRDAYLALLRQIAVGLALELLETVISPQEPAPSRITARRRSKKAPVRKGGKTS